MMTGTESSLEETNQILSQGKEVDEPQDELQYSTTASNLNKSNDNLCQKDLKSNLDLSDEVRIHFKRKLSAPPSINSIIGLNISKYGKCPRSSYFNSLLCKGLLF